MYDTVLLRTMTWGVWVIRTACRLEKQD